MKKWILICIMLVMVGITGFVFFKFSTPKTTVILEFKENLKINIDKNKTYHAIEFIKNYNNEGTILFPKVKTQLGKQLLTYTINETNNTSNVYTIEIEMVDEVAPTIKIKNNTFTYEYNDTIPTQFNEVYEITDNYDEIDQIKIDVMIPNIYEIGENKVIIKACDTSQNCAENEIVVIKKEQPKEEKKEEHNIIQTPQQTSSSQHQSDPAPSTRQSKKGQYKTFLFTEGYTMQTVEQACVRYLESMGSGMCRALKKENHYIGMEYIP